MGTLAHNSPLQLLMTRSQKLSITNPNLTQHTHTLNTLLPITQTDSYALSLAILAVDFVVVIHY